MGELGLTTWIPLKRLPIKNKYKKDTKLNLPKFENFKK